MNKGRFFPLEILTKEQYGEYEEFLLHSENGMFHQSPEWGKVKNKFITEIIAARGEDGKIKAGMLVLIRPIVLGYSIMYAPRGPVCDPHDKVLLAELMEGAKVLAKKYKSYVLKMDPNIRKDDEEFVQIMQSLGGSFKFDGSDFSSSLQPSVVYILDIAGRTPDEMFMHFPYKTRYAIRSAAKFGVEVRECGRESLPEFYEIMQETCERDHFSVRPLSYFERMYDEMGDHLKLYLSYYESKAISGAINITYGNRSLHLYGASSNSHRDKMPNYAMQWKMISTAAANGIRLYDFGGIAAVEDESSPLYGLYVFKRKFRGEVVEYVGEIEVVFRPAVNKLLGFAYNLRRKILRGPGRKKK